MGHNHFFGSNYMLETENDQSWNLTDHPYMNIARSGDGESSNLTYPADNMSIDVSQYASHCNHAPMPAGYSSLSHNLQIPNYHQDVSGPSVLHIHPTSAGNFYTTPVNNGNQASSSNFTGNPFEEDLFDITMGNGRNQYKRKSPGVPDGNSSDINMHETPNTNFVHAPWDYPTGAENSLRNVRNRAEFDFERTHFSNNLSRDYYTTSRAMDVSPSIDLLGQSSNSLINCELNPFSNHSAPIMRSNHVSQNFQGALVQSVRGVRSSHSQSQRPVLTFRASSSNSQVVRADEGLQLATNNYSSRHPRPSARARMSSERYRSFSGVNFRDRPTPEGLMIVDRSAFNGSRNPFDQHRNMRLDIDDMSYEELLALGERIGSVGTGLPEHLISKCVQESIYCSSDEAQDEGTCVICLEEYANMDDIGMLKGCGHDFHVGCIKKWLSMKNLCPICKAEPIKHK